MNDVIMIKRYYCLDCGTKLETIQGENLKQELHVDPSGDFIVLCRPCWNFWRDKTKNPTDNPRSMSRVEI